MVLCHERFEIYNMIIYLIYDHGKLEIDRQFNLSNAYRKVYTIIILIEMKYYTKHITSKELVILTDETLISPKNILQALTKISGIDRLNIAISKEYLTSLDKLPVVYKSYSHTPLPILLTKSNSYHR